MDQTVLLSLYYLLAAVCGLLAAVRSVDRDAEWEVGVGVNRCNLRLSSGRLEALVLLLSRDQLLPLILAPASEFNELKLVEALRKLCNLSW